MYKLLSLTLRLLEKDSDIIKYMVEGPVRKSVSIKINDCCINDQELRLHECHISNKANGEAEIFVSLLPEGSKVEYVKDSI
jgi:hypothetical protein